MILVAAALVSCSENEVNPIGGDDVAITLRSGVQSASGDLTRAPFVGNPASDHILEARVIGDDLASFAGVPTVNGIMKFKGELGTNFETTGLTGDATFASASPVYLFGLYPSSWVYENGGSATLNFTGSEDLMGTEQVSTTKAEVTAGTYKQLVFKHLLTRLRVSLSASDAAQTALGDVTAIKLIGDIAGTATVKNKATYTNTGSIVMNFTTLSSATSMNFYALSADGKTYTDDLIPTYTLTGEKTFVAYSMVAPVDATDANKTEYFLEITTTTGGSKKVGVDLIAKDGSAFALNTAGYSFDIAIKFKDNNQITVDAVVEDWDEQGEWQGEVSVD